MTNRQYIADQHVIERYLADQLDDAEREAFEAYWREHPEIVADIEAVARLKVGLAALRDSNELTTLLSPRRSLPRLAAVAAAVAIVAVGIVAWLATRPPSEAVLAAAISSLQDRSGRPISIGTTHSIFRTRGASSDATIELPPSPQAIELRILPELDAPAPALHRLQLLREEGDGRLTSIGSIESLPRAPDGLVTAYLNSGRLSPGRYRLRLDESEFTLSIVARTDAPR